MIKKRTKIKKIQEFSQMFLDCFEIVICIMLGIYLYINWVKNDYLYYYFSLYAFFEIEILIGFNVIMLFESWRKVILIRKIRFCMLLFPFIYLYIRFFIEIGEQYNEHFVVFCCINFFLLIDFFVIMKNDKRKDE